MVSVYGYQTTEPNQYIYLTLKRQLNPWFDTVTTISLPYLRSELTSVRVHEAVQKGYDPLFSSIKIRPKARDPNHEIWAELPEPLSQVTRKSDLQKFGFSCRISVLWPGQVISQLHWNTTTEPKFQLSCWDLFYAYRLPFNNGHWREIISGMILVLVWNVTHWVSAFLVSPI